MSFELPKEFKQRMMEDLGDEAQAFFDSYEKEPVRSLRLLNEEAIHEKGKLPFDLRPIPWCKTGFYYGKEDTPGKHVLHEAGAYYIQEASAMCPVTKLDVTPGMRVLDLCASPGGKSTQIAGMLGSGEGILITNEIHPTRAKILSENIERMGVRNALVLNETPQSLSVRFEGFFDRILVDAPCSGEGMFRKHPEGMQEWSLENVKMCAGRQKEILAEAVKMLAPGGRLVYSTCTFAKAEDEEIVDWILSEYPAFSLLEKEKIFPHKVEGEGHFMAVFRKEGEEDASLCKALPLGGFEQGLTKSEEKSITAFYDFLKETICEDSIGVFSGKKVLFGEQLFLLPTDCPSLKGLKVLRPGLHLGTVKKDRFEPAHALALTLPATSVKTQMNLSVQDAGKYIEGYSLPIELAMKGWVHVTYEGFSLAWGKAAGGMLKNHYPKGLRKRIDSV